MASKNTTIVIVILACVAVALLAVCAGTVLFLVWGTREAAQFVGEEMQKELQRQQFAETWQPPPEDADPEALFPEQVSGFQRTSHDEQAGISEYDIDVPGRHAVYESDAATIEIFAYQVSGLEAEALIRRVADTIEEREDGYRFHMGSPESGRYRYEITPPSETGYLWSSQGWLFFFRTPDDPDLEAFADDYLRAIEGDAQPETSGTVKE